MFDGLRVHRYFLNTVFYIVVAATAVAAIGCSGRDDPGAVDVPEKRALLQNPRISEPLIAGQNNKRYFTNIHGDTVYLAGASTWTVLQDRGPTDPPDQFDYLQFLDVLQSNNLNFFRMFVWEQPRWSPGRNYDFYYDPVQYGRTGPGLANDGKPKFDLNLFEERYFARLKERVEIAEGRGIYVAVMLFQGWSVDDKGLQGYTPWASHPFNVQNNVNGIDGDNNNDGKGTEVHSLLVPNVLELQKAYLRKVVDTIGSFNNVLFEVCNECASSSADWQRYVVDYIREIDSLAPPLHPVGMTIAWPQGDNAVLYDSSADWLSPKLGQDERLDTPFPNNTGKVSVYDTDHLCGVCGNVPWVWKSFLQGHNLMLMDPYSTATHPTDSDVLRSPVWSKIRRNLGYTIALSRKLPMGSMCPSPETASSGYAFVSHVGAPTHVVVYFPDSARVSVDLSDKVGELQTEWLDFNGGHRQGREVIGGQVVWLRSPYKSGSILHIFDSTDIHPGENR
jgi:hypothetical protein